MKIRIGSIEIGYSDSILTFFDFNQKWFLSKCGKFNAWDIAMPWRRK